MARPGRHDDGLEAVEAVERRRELRRRRRLGGSLGRSRRHVAGLGPGSARRHAVGEVQGRLAEDQRRQEPLHRQSPGTGWCACRATPYVHVRGFYTLVIWAGVGKGTAPVLGLLNLNEQIFI